MNQFLYENPDKKFFRDQARRYGFGESSYLQALEEVPVLDREHACKILSFAASLSAILGELCLTRLEERRRAEKKIQTLSGLLPICASCKKIRDDQGYWKQVEEYIMDHADVEFSHGLCEECMEKLYGNEEWFNEK